MNGLPVLLKSIGTEVSRVATQSVSAATETPISFDSRVRDELQIWNAATPTVLKIRVPGLYIIQADLLWTTASATYKIIRVYVNSEVVSRNDMFGNIAAGKTCFTIKHLKGGDQVSLTSYHSSGTNNMLGQLALLKIQEQE